MTALLVSVWVTEAGICFRLQCLVPQVSRSPLFLTFLLQFVYLLGGMWNYVRPNLSQSTHPSVTWATGQRTHHYWLTHRQTAWWHDSAAVWQLISKLWSNKKVTTVKFYYRFTHATCACVMFLHRVWAQPPDTCTFTTNNWAFTVTHRR